MRAWDTPERFKCLLSMKSFHGGFVRTEQHALRTGSFDD